MRDSISEVCKFSQKPCARIPEFFKRGLEPEFKKVIDHLEACNVISDGKKDDMRLPGAHLKYFLKQ